MKFIPVILAGLLLSGCSYLDTATEWSVPKIAKGVDWYCESAGMFPETRQETIDAINAETETGDITAFDCDSDGEPDF